MNITWRTWQGSGDETAAPGGTELPWVRLTPMELPLRLKEEAALGGQFRVRFEVAVRGTAFADLANTAYAVRRAIHFNRPYRGRTLLEIFREAGVVIYEITQAGTAAYRAAQAATEPSQPAPPPVVDLVASGFVEFDLFEDVIR